MTCAPSVEQPPLRGPTPRLQAEQEAAAVPCPSWQAAADSARRLVGQQLPPRPRPASSHCASCHAPSAGSQTVLAGRSGSHHFAALNQEATWYVS